MSLRPSPSSRLRLPTSPQAASHERRRLLQPARGSRAAGDTSPLGSSPAEEAGQAAETPGPACEQDCQGDQYGGHSSAADAANLSCR
jgi:hypothetical protein